MGVGAITRGALKDLSPVKAQDTYRPLNIDRESKREKTMAAEIRNRQPPQSAYDCDNLYRHLSVPGRRVYNFSQLMNYETTPMDKSLYGSACSTNYYYFGKLSMPQKGEIAPVRSGEGGGRPQNVSNLSSFDRRMISTTSARAEAVGTPDTDGGSLRPGEVDHIGSLDAQRRQNN